MRKKAVFAPRICADCGATFIPNGSVQKYCHECGVKRDKERKYLHYRKKFPDAKPKQRCTGVCCVCGGEFSAHFEGKPYCSKHYLRMRRNGTVELKQRKITNTYSTDGAVTTVTTKSGRTFIVDTADLPLVQRYSWCFSKTGYLVANIRNKVVKLHRYLLDPDPGKVVDHMNGDPSDNRRCNLRICSPADNAKNCSVSRSSKSGVLGVRILKSGKYSAFITVGRKTIELGHFGTMDEAVDARQIAEMFYFGEFSTYFSRTSTITQGTDA